MPSRIPNLLLGTLIGTVFIMGQDGRDRAYYTSKNGSNTTVIPKFRSSLTGLGVNEVSGPI